MRSLLSIIDERCAFLATLASVLDEQNERVIKAPELDVEVYHAMRRLTFRQPPNDAAGKVKCMRSKANFIPVLAWVVGAYSTNEEFRDHDLFAQFFKAAFGFEKDRLSPVPSKDKRWTDHLAYHLANVHSGKTADSDIGLAPTLESSIATIKELAELGVAVWIQRRAFDYPATDNSEPQSSDTTEKKFGRKRRKGDRFATMHTSALEEVRREITLSNPNRRALAAALTALGKYMGIKIVPCIARGTVRAYIDMNSLAEALLYGVLLYGINAKIIFRTVFGVSVYNSCTQKFSQYLSVEIKDHNLMKNGYRLGVEHLLSDCVFVSRTIINTHGLELDKWTSVQLKRPSNWLPASLTDMGESVDDDLILPGLRLERSLMRPEWEY